MQPGPLALPGQPHHRSLHPQRLHLYVAQRQEPFPLQEERVFLQTDCPLSLLSGCLYFIAKALERDHCYTKGLVLKEKIFEEQPCLKMDTKHMFTKW